MKKQTLKQVKILEFNREEFVGQSIAEIQDEINCELSELAKADCSLLFVKESVLCPGNIFVSIYYDTNEEVVY